MGYFGVESNRATAHAAVDLSPAGWNEKIGEEYSILTPKNDFLNSREVNTQFVIR